MSDFVLLSDPPMGKVEGKFIGPTSFIRWAPGNGLAYQMFASRLLGDARKYSGGDILLSLDSHQGIVAYPGSLGLVYSTCFVREKWGSLVESDEAIHYYTSLLNWALGDGSSYVASYAMEIYEWARKTWR